MFFFLQVNVLMINPKDYHMPIREFQNTNSFYNIFGIIDLILILGQLTEYYMRKRSMKKHAETPDN